MYSQIHMKMPKSCSVLYQILYVNLCTLKASLDFTALFKMILLLSAVLSHMTYNIAIVIKEVHQLLSQTRSFSPVVLNPVIDCTNGLESSKMCDMTKMCLQCPVTFRVYLPLTWSVNDDLMVQITLFPECPHGVRLELWLGSKWASPLCGNVCVCVSVCEREGEKERVQIDFLSLTNSWHWTSMVK